MGQSKRNWTVMPLEVLKSIFSGLSTRDKLAFVLVCPKWSDAAEVSTLWWRSVVIKVDLDFEEPSVIFLAQRYARFVESLEIGWSIPYEFTNRNYWINHKQITKKVGKFLNLMYEKKVQVKHLTIVNWYDIYQFKKLCHFLVGFIKIQTRLETLTLINANLCDLEFAHILSACLKSTTTLKHITLHYSTFNSKKLFTSNTFTECMDTFDYLEVLTMDCWIFLKFYKEFSKYPKLTSMYRLQLLNLYLDDSLRKFDCLEPVSRNKWEKFPRLFPNAVVNLRVEKPMSDEHFKRIIQENYPLVSFDWNYLTHKVCLMDCCQCLDRLARLQYQSLEHINLNLPLQECQLEEKFQNIQRKCRNLKSFVFNNDNVLFSEEVPFVNVT